jgi:transcription antitermination factor NusG
MQVCEGSAREPNDMQDAPWYVLQVHTRREKWIAHALRTSGKTVCLPLQDSLREWSDRRTRVELPLFPGYVFCQFDLASGASIFEVPGVLSIVGSGGRGIAIEPEEAQALQALERAKVSVDPWPCLKAGDWVVVESGALYGLIGILLDSRKTARVVVSMTLLNRAVAVEVDRAAVKPVKQPKQYAPVRAALGSSTW